MRARSNLVSEEALKLSELAANRDAYKAEEKHYLVRNIIFKVTFHNRKIIKEAHALWDVILQTVSLTVWKMTS